MKQEQAKKFYSWISLRKSEKIKRQIYSSKECLNRQRKEKHSFNIEKLNRDEEENSFRDLKFYKGNDINIKNKNYFLPILNKLV